MTSYSCLILIRAIESRCRFDAPLLFGMLLLAASLGVSAQVPDQAELICSSVDGSGPAYLYQTADGNPFTLSFSVQKDGSYSSRRVDISRAAIAELCRKGLGVALIPSFFANEGTKSAFFVVDSRKYVPPTWTLPSSFSIYKAYVSGVGYVVIGNFWIPKSMPGGQANQWSAMNLVTSNFSQTTDGAHFVHSLLTYSDDNIQLSMSGQGLIFGRFAVASPPYGFACGNWGLSYASAVETWGNYQGGKVHWMIGEDTPSGVPAGQRAWPNTCAPQLQDGTAYGFLIGTAQSRWINYSLYYANQSSPFYSSPSFQAGTLYGSPGGFVFNSAGEPILWQTVELQIPCNGRLVFPA